MDAVERCKRPRGAVETFALALVVSLLGAGCYLSHERGRPGADAGADVPAMDDVGVSRDGGPRRDGGGTCVTARPYRPASSPADVPPTLRARHAPLAASSFRFVPTPTGFAAAVDENEDDTAVLTTVLLAFDRAGEPLWRHAFDEPITGPVVADDGTLWVGLRGGTLVSMGADGNITSEHLVRDLHSALWLSAMDSTGRLIIMMPDWALGAGIVLGLDPCLGEIWRLGFAAVPIGGPAEDASGRLYFATDQHVYVVTLDGDFEASHGVGAFINGHPTLLRSGEVAVTSVVGTGVDDASSATRVTLLDRASSRSFDVPGRWHPGRSPLAESGDGGLLIRGWTDVVLVDVASGTERWRAFAHPNLIYDARPGPAGGVVVLSQSLSLLDAATGTRRWTFDAPTGASCVDGIAIDRGVLLASQCDGSYFAAGW